MTGLEGVEKWLNTYVFVENLPSTDESVKLKPYTAADLKRLLLSSEDRAEEALDELLEACVLDKGFDLENISIQDRFYLLVKLRTLTKGTQYRFQYSCPDCLSQQIVNLDLKQMKVKKLPKNWDYSVKLDANIEVVLGFVTRKNVKDAENLVDKDQPIGARIFEQTLKTYAGCIKSIKTPDGEYSPTLEDGITFLEKAPEAMFEKIKDWFDSIDFGLDFTFTWKCDNEKCKVRKKEAIPLDNFLF